MPAEKAGEIAACFDPREFEKNELVLKQGRVCNEYHFICSGFLRSWTTDLEGRDVTTAFFPAGNVACELFSFFKRVPAMENIQALCHCTTLSISFEELQRVFHAMPEFREFGRTILVNAYATLKQRMLSGLHQTAEQRYRELIQASPEVFQHASLRQIASYLGVTDTSLSRIRKEFSREH